MEHGFHFAETWGRQRDTTTVSRYARGVHQTSPVANVRWRTGNDEKRPIGN